MKFYECFSQAIIKISKINEFGTEDQFSTTYYRSFDNNIERCIKDYRFSNKYKGQLKIDFKNI